MRKRFDNIQQVSTLRYYFASLWCLREKKSSEVSVFLKRFKTLKNNPDKGDSEHVYAVLVNVLRDNREVHFFVQIFQCVLRCIT